MSRQVEKVAVLGSGVMGSAIAAHFANAGVPSLVLDIVPTELTAQEKAAGKTLQDRSVRNRIASQAVAALGKTRPSPLYSPKRLDMIEVGNLQDDLPRLQEVDWVIEAVKEDMGIKKKVFTAIAPHLANDAILSSNTSGLSLQEMAEILPEELRPRFLGTHFFNPPRYMKLFELITTSYTDPALADWVANYAQNHLGKGIVWAKDTPNFIANRVGVHAMMATVAVMQEMELSIEEVDALTGPAIGRPRTATFKLADLVGLDTFVHVADNLHPLIPDDEARDTFLPPDYLREMVNKGLLGRKSGAGFYKMEKDPDGKKTFYTIDLQTLEFREKQKVKFGELDAAKTVDDTQDRLRQLAWGKGRASQAIWKMLAATLSYSAMRLGEICDDCISIDRALRWGFNWELGPFEIWDVLGFRKTTDRLREEGYPLPAWIDALYESGAESLYLEEDGTLYTPTATAGERKPVPRDERRFDFTLLRKAGQEVKSNPGASLLDLGDGVLCLEFHSKMNAIGQDTINMIMTACSEAEENWEALIVANAAENFSVGANLMLLMMEAQEGNWEEINMIVRAFQGATNRLERCQVPVVTAPHGLALGGGCEITMGGNAIRAAAETYIGLVEFGAGVIPAGGGCLRLYKRHVATLPDSKDLYPALKKTFETIGMAKVATSAEEGRQLGFLRPGDGWSMNRDHLTADAKDLALSMARSIFEPPRPDPAIPVMGSSGMALVESVLFNMGEAQYISEHDQLIGRELGRVITGGDIPGPTTISEPHMLDLERESFLRLMGEIKTLQRMEHILKLESHYAINGLKEKAMREVIVAAAKRTAVGKAYKGTLRQTRPDDLGAAAVKGLLASVPNLDPARIGDVIMGCAMPEGEQGMNVGRNIVLLAGLPDSVPGMTVNRFCSSGLETVNYGAYEIATGQCDIVIAGGVESMTMIPMGGFRYLPNPSLVQDDPQAIMGMGLTAEQLVQRDDISREQQDRFALASHQKAVAANEQGRFTEEIIPVEAKLSVPDEKGKPAVHEVEFKVDEGPRADTTLEALARLKPAFKFDGTVTAGNSSQMSDGAAAILLTTPEIATELGLQPLARFVTYAVAGVPPEIMGIGPVAAIPKAMARAGLSLDDMAVIELNEAFAAQSLAVLKNLNLDPEDERINANGGAIALGHPLGCTGAKLTTTALHELKRRGDKYALVTMCIGTGMGAAGIFEAVD